MDLSRGLGDVYKRQVMNMVNLPLMVLLLETLMLKVAL
jgi:hypothetical protein